MVGLTLKIAHNDTHLKQDSKISRLALARERNCELIIHYTSLS